MRVWGRVQGSRHRDKGDPLGTPGFVWGFLEVPLGAAVDVQVGRWVFPAVLVTVGPSSATFLVGQKHRKRKRQLTLSAADYRIHAARRIDGNIIPDYDQRTFRHLLSESARIDREGW